MTLTQNKKIFQVIIGVVALIIVVILISIIFALSSSKKADQKTISYAIVPPQKDVVLSTNIQELKKNLIASPIKNDNDDLLLYKDTNFYIEYITSPDVFFVKITSNTKSSKQDAQKWFTSKGFKQEDLCLISVRFMLTTTDLRKENPNFSSLPDGCSGQPIKKP